MHKSHFQRYSIVAAALAAALALGACSSTPPVTQAQIDTDLSNAVTLIANGCKVVQPTLAGVAPLTGNAAVNVASSANGVFCAANEAAAAGVAVGASTVAPASAPAAK